MKIEKIQALENLDSRGKPTVFVELSFSNGLKAQSLVPSGASTGSHEALELRDADQSRFLGQGVLQALLNIETIISPALKNFEFQKIEELDEFLIKLDGTKDKSRLGANSILAISLAGARGLALEKGQELYEYLSSYSLEKEYKLPMPMLNLLNGGEHANWAADIQEYMLVPIGASSIFEAIKMGAEVYAHLKNLLKSKGLSSLLGDEGGFAPSLANNEEAFSFLREAIDLAGYQIGQDIVFALDIAASEFFKEGKYQLRKNGLVLDSQGLAQYYKTLLKTEPIVSIEDPFFEDDWESFSQFTKEHPKLQIVGDDLYVTRQDRLNKGIELGASNSILIKVNQVGTLSEAITVLNLAKKKNLSTIISHRSGETEDSFIADLAVALGAGQIKTGAPSRSERTAKYNRLIKIAADLGDRASLAKFPFPLT